MIEAPCVDRSSAWWTRSCFGRREAGAKRSAMPGGCLTSADFEVRERLAVVWQSCHIVTVTAVPSRSLPKRVRGPTIARRSAFRARRSIILDLAVIFCHGLMKSL
jgi:hypothetical protein